MLALACHNYARRAIRTPVVLLPFRTGLGEMRLLMRFKETAPFSDYIRRGGRIFLLPERHACLLPHRAAAGTARNVASDLWLGGGSLLPRGREQPLEAWAGCCEVYFGCFGSNLRTLSTSSTVKREKDFYQLLGVSSKAGPRAIRAAYLRKAKELHPDANAHCPRRHHKERLFREVTEAYEVLADPAKREEYDAQRPPEEPSYKEKRRSTDDWHLGRDEVGEEFWRQVEQIRKEKERAWRTMKVCAVQSRD